MNTKIFLILNYSKGGSVQNYKFALFFLFCFFFAKDLSAGSAGRSYNYETQEIVLYPTAGMVNNNQLFNLDFIGNEIFVLSFETLLIKNLSIGASIAFEKFLGNKSNLSFKDYPSIKVKYRFIDEGKYYPAMMIGFDSKNFLDIQINTTEQYHHSIGPFLVLSKAFSWQLGILGVHLGANVPIEFNPNQKGNFYFGVEHTLNNFVSVAVEYDYNGAYNKKVLPVNRILNIGLKYSIDRNVTLQFYVVDVLSQNFNKFKIFNLQFISKMF